MTPQAAVKHEQAQRPVCWCCGHTFDERDLTRLGSHPEVGVCAGCAQWLHRRARSTFDARRNAPAAVLRRAVRKVRSRAMSAGAQDWPLVGSLLRQLDRYLP